MIMFNIKIQKKKLLIITVIIFLVVVLIIGSIIIINKNQDETPTLKEIVDEKLSAYETDITDSLESFTTNKDIANYLLNWAKNKKIDVSCDSSDNVIYSVKAGSKELKDKTPVVIVCEFDSSNMDGYIAPMAAALTVAKNAQNNQPFKILFLSSKNGNHMGAQDISARYFNKDTRVICLGNSNSTKISLETGGYEEYVVSRKLRYTKTSYDKAYKIKITGIPSEISNSTIDSRPNAVKTLGNLLAYFNSTSFNFEIASFSGGEGANTTPENAYVTLVINSDDTEKFTNKMTSAIDKFNDKYLENYPEAKYTFEEVPLPDKVIKKSNADDIVSLMYTAINGVYYKDDDGNIVSLTNIGSASSKNSKLRILVSALSYSEESMSEIRDSYKTISGLSNMKFAQVEKYPIFNGSEESEALIEAFSTAFSDFTDGSDIDVKSSVEFTPCSFIKTKNENCSIFFCSMTDKSKKKIAGSLLKYLEYEEEA